MEKVKGRNDFFRMLSLVAMINLMGCEVTIKGEDGEKPIKEGVEESNEMKEETTEKLPIRSVVVRPGIVGLDETEKYFLEFIAADGRRLFVNRPKKLPEVCEEKDVLDDPDRLVIKCHEFFKAIPMMAQEVGKEIHVDIFEAPEMPIVRLRLMQEGQEGIPIIVSEILADLNQPAPIKINASGTFVYRLYFKAQHFEKYDLGCLMNPYREFRDKVALVYQNYQSQNGSDSNLEDALITINDKIFLEDQGLQDFYQSGIDDLPSKCELTPVILD
ncbi:MAG: hypothetical protein AABY86_00405 [Bdellovibrionota bacterium]